MQCKREESRAECRIEVCRVSGIMPVAICFLIILGRLLPARAEQRIIDHAVSAKSELRFVSRLVGLHICFANSVVGDSDGTQLSEFSGTPGSKAIVQIQLQSGSIIGLDAQRSKVSSFKDVKGDDLRPKKLGDTLGAWYQISNKRDAAVVVVEAENPPPDGTSGMQVKGLLRVMAATRKSKAKTGSIPFTKGTAITAGPIRMTLKDVGTDPFSGKPTLELESRSNLSALAGMTVYDRDDQKVQAKMTSSGTLKVSVSSTGSSRELGQTIWTQSLVLDHPIQQGAIEIEYWSDLQDRDVPFDIHCGIDSERNPQGADRRIKGLPVQKLVPAETATRPADK